MNKSTTMRQKGSVLVSLRDVVTPTTVENFRNNLRRFFVTAGKNDLWVKTETSQMEPIPIDDISDFSDIYKITKTGFHGDGSSPAITPSVVFTDFKVRDHMMSSGQLFSFHGFFDDEDNFVLYDIGTQEQQRAFVQSKEYGVTKNLSWFSLDNQILRGFYAKVLGQFSGYDDFGIWVNEETNIGSFTTSVESDG